MLAFAAVDVVAGAAEGETAWTEGELYREAFVRGPDRDKMNTAGSSMTRVVKRLNFGSPEAMDHDGGGGDINHQGPPQFCQEVNIKRGRYKRVLRRLIKKINRSNVSMVCRWQSLTDNFQKTLTLSQSLSYFTRVNDIYLPVYAFNISALPFNKHNASGSVVDAQTYPLYRLYKTSTNTYRWEPTVGNNNSNDGQTESYTWTREDVTSATGTTQQITDYTLDWVNFRLMLKGAHDLDTKVDVMEVSFLNDGAPIRQYWNGSTSVENDPAPTGDQENEITAWWDHYLAARTAHPFRTTTLPKSAIPKFWKIWRKKTMTFSPVSQGNKVEGILGDVVGYTKCLNIFNRYDYDCQLRSVNPNTVTVDTQRVVGTSIPQIPGYPVNTSNTQMEVYGTRERDRWIIISAHAYTKANGDSVNLTEYPSFDLCVRQKVLYDE